MVNNDIYKFRVLLRFYMIPKLIHYCWFGSKEKPAFVIKCIDSWKKFLPDYKIIEWNESNFDISNTNKYVRDAYENKKWAFVTDYVRLKALVEYGGVYFDTDVEVFKSFDKLLNNKCFFGFESNDYICTAVIGCEKDNLFIKNFMDSYETRDFILPDGTLDILTTNVVIVTSMLLEKGMKPNGKQQELKDVTIFPQYYFSSNDIRNIFHKYNSEIYSYHHCQASWYNNYRDNSFWNRFRHYLIGKFRNMLGTDILISLKH